MTSKKDMSGSEGNTSPMISKKYMSGSEGNTSPTTSKNICQAVKEIPPL